VTERAVPRPWGSVQGLSACARCLSRSTARGTSEGSSSRSPSRQRGKKLKKRQPRLRSVPLPGRGRARCLGSGSLRLCGNGAPTQLKNSREKARLSPGSSLLLSDREACTGGTVRPCWQFPFRDSSANYNRFCARNKSEKHRPHLLGETLTPVRASLRSSCAADKKPVFSQSDASSSR